MKIKSAIVIFSALFLILLSIRSEAQFRNSGKTTVTYEELYDTPGEVNALFIHFQPIYGELFVSNVNMGFGLQAEYHLNDKFDFQVHGRTTYTQKLDVAREDAEKNSNVNLNSQDRFSRFFYIEGGGTYHINDREMDTETKLILYSKRYKPRKWAAKVPDHIKVPSKVRKYYGVRLGGLYYQTTTDLDRAMEAQGTMIVDESDNPISEDAVVFGNVSSAAAYVGGSMSWIWNFAIKPDKSYGVLSNDLYFTTFVDLIIAPSISIDDIFYEGAFYSADNIETTSFGFRAGMQGKFNRQLGWAYGAEVGMRPGVSSRAFYTLIKISFPVFSTNLEHEKEAFGK
jgi:hypothetical protein